MILALFYMTMCVRRLLSDFGAASNWNSEVNANETEEMRAMREADAAA